MENKVGIIGLVARTYPAKGGFKLEGSNDWLNPNEKVRGFVPKLNKGDRISYSANNGIVSYLKVITEETQQNSPEERIENSKLKGETIGMAVKEANKFVQANILFNRSVNKAFNLSDPEWAKAICDKAEVLLLEMQSRGW